MTPPMSTQFNSYIDNIDTGYWRTLCQNRGELRHFDRNQTFIAAGTIGRHFGFIHTGALKYECYSSDGTPHVVGLEFAGHFVCDFPGSIYNQKSRCSIITTVPSDIYCLPTTVVIHQMRTDPRAAQIIADTTRAVFSTVYDRLVDLYTKTPQQRYLQLLSRDPDIFRLFSLRDIASLLNITPTHLSRLRRIQPPCSNSSND